jgi:hypothetical protein
MVCSDGEKASIPLLLGVLNVIAINKIEMESGGKKWSTSGEGTRIAAGGTVRIAGVGAGGGELQRGVKPGTWRPVLGAFDFNSPATHDIYQ